MGEDILDILLINLIVEKDFKNLFQTLKTIVNIK